MKKVSGSSSAAAAEGAVSSITSFTNTIKGEASSHGTMSHALNPSTRQTLWDVPIATNDDVQTAVAAANEAFRSWSRTPWNKRAEYLNQAKNALMDIRDDMAVLITQEAGKPVCTPNKNINGILRY